MAYELIKVSELPELTTPSDPNVLPIQDGDYLKRISFENLKEAATGDVAGDLAAEVTARESAVSGEATARGNADTAILADLASPYSASATYAVGDYCTKDGQLYRCTTAISTAEAWTSGHWSAVALGDDTRDLRSALNDEVSLLREDIGRYNYYNLMDVTLVDVTGTGAYRAGCDCGVLPEGSYLLYFKKEEGTSGSLVVTTEVNGVYTQSTGITTSPYLITLSVPSRVIVRGSVTTVDAWNYYDVELVQADAVDVNEDVRALRANVCEKIKGWISGGYIASGGVGSTVTLEIYSTSVNSWKSVIVECSEGDIFTISGLGGGAFRLWCFLDVDNKILDVSGTRAKLDSVAISAPKNSAKLIIQQDIEHTTLVDCYKGTSPYKESYYSRAENKAVTLSTQWESGEVNTSGLVVNPENIRTFYSIGFNQGEKLVFTNTKDRLFMAVYANKQNTFTPVVNGWIEKNSQIIVDDWTCTYFGRARKKEGGNIDYSLGADIRVELVNENIPEVKYDNNYQNKLASVGFTRTFSYANPFLTFQRKNLKSDGTLEDSTTKVVAELPKVGCVEVRQEINTGCFKIAKVSGSTVTYLVDEWSYYSYRYVGDASSTYYVIIANSANPESTITSSNAAHYIGVYTFTDVGKDAAHLNKLNGKKVAFIGDSITQGRFAKFGAGSPNYTAIKPFGELVAEEIGDYNFGQYGIGGACVYNIDWRSLYLNCTKVTGYDVVFVCGGTNDYGNNVSQADFTAAYEYVIETLLANNTEVVVCTPVYRTSSTAANSQGLTLTDYANIEKTIASDNDLKVIDQYTLTNNGTFSNYLPDGLHPDEMGHRIMADNILNEYNRL